MNVELSHAQHEALVELLAEVATQYSHEAATLLRYQAGRELGLERLKQAEQAAALFNHLTQY